MRLHKFKFGFWLLATIILIPSLIYAIQRLYQLDFTDNLFAGLLSTIIGLVLGIPIALELNRRQQVAEQQERNESQQREELQRSRKILNLLRAELVDAQVGLGTRNNLLPQYRSYAMINHPPFKNQLWHSFSDGGELQWVKDLDLLNSLSTAYHRIQVTIFLEEMYFHATHFVAERALFHSKHPHQYILEYMVKEWKSMEEAIAITLKDIDAHLPPAGKE